MAVKRSQPDIRRAASARPAPPALDAPRARGVELMWNPRPTRQRGPKPALSVEGIARAAIAIADADGLAAVSMQRVAESFGFTTMSLYRYVPGRTELVDLMFDTGMGPPPDLAAIAGGWRPKLETWARRLWDLVLRHPWALDVLTRLRLPGPNELAWIECGAHALAESGLGGAALLDGLFLVVGQVRMVAQYAIVVPEASGGLTTGEWAAGLDAILRTHGATFPVLRAATSAGAFAPVDDPLAFGLACVLDGLERRVAGVVVDTLAASARQQDDWKPDGENVNGGLQRKAPRRER